MRRLLRDLGIHGNLASGRTLHRRSATLKHRGRRPILCDRRPAGVDSRLVRPRSPPHRRSCMPSRLDFIQRANATYIEGLYARYREDPGSVPEDWAIFFAGFDLAEERTVSGDRGGPAGGVLGLILAYREFG